MRFFHHLLSLFLLFNFSLNAQKKLYTYFEIREYGLHKSEVYQNAKSIVGERWKIRFRSVAQCLITQELKDSTDAFNRHSDSLISLKYGKNWRKKFDVEIKKEEKTVSRLIDQIKKLDYIFQLDSTLAQKGNGLNYFVYPVTNSKSEREYTVLVFGWGTIDAVTDLVVYYQLECDKRKNSIKIVDDKPQFLENEP